MYPEFIYIKKEKKRKKSLFFETAFTRFSKKLENLRFERNPIYKHNQVKW